MPLVTRLGILCLLVTSSFVGYGLHTFEINDATQDFLFNEHYIEYLEDPTGELTLQDVLTEKYQGQFVKSDYEFVDRDVPHTPRPESYYWIRVQIKHTNNTKHEWILEFANQSVDHIDVYLPKKDVGYETAVIGDNYAFPQRQFQHKNNEVLLPNDLEGTHTYYFRVQCRHTVDIVIILRSLERFVGYALSEYILFGVFFGMLLVVTVYNLLMFLALGERQFLFYILYTFCFGMYFASHTGIAFQYIWPSWTEWNQIAKEIAQFAAVILGLQFTRLFLNLPGQARRMDLLVVGVMVFRGLVFLVALFEPKIFLFRIIEVIPISAALYAGIHVYRRNYRPARYYVLAYALLLFGAILKALLSLGLLPHFHLLFYADVVGFAFEIFLLMFALADKVSIIRAEKEAKQNEIINHLEENERLKDKVNRELEQKVKERTTELHDAMEQIQRANKQLEEQADEINRMNMLLDLDNRNLRKDIQQTIEARIKVQTVDLDEFKRVFPDKLACMRFLAEKKKEQGFECRKCGNEKYSAGAKKFSRRCTKCGYNESVTAYTIFHGVRFPIEKAFYIFYLTISHDKNITVDEIAEKVDLRRNTCWSFRNKVLKLVEKYQLKNKEEYWDKLFDTVK